MTHRRIIYFLAHALLVAVGTAVSLVGNGQTEPTKTVLIAIGTSLIATGAAGMIIWVYLARVERNSDKLDNFFRAGLEWVHERRAAQIRNEYATRLQKATDQIDIIGFGLSDFRRDYIDELGAMSARAQIRILLLDPSSDYASQRDKEEGQTVGTISAEITEFVSQYQKRYSTSPPVNLRLKFYTSLPLLNVFRIDNETFFGPYLAGKASGNTFTMRVARGSIFDQLATHFEELWEHHSRDV